MSNASFAQARPWPGAANLRRRTLKTRGGSGDYGGSKGGASARWNRNDNLSGNVRIEFLKRGATQDILREFFRGDETAIQDLREFFHGLEIVTRREHTVEFLKAVHYRRPHRRVVERFRLWRIAANKSSAHLQYNNPTCH
ncbi:MAG TPA: hypothetical protein VF278_17280 [Pirellulales bacterium]